MLKTLILTRFSSLFNQSFRGSKSKKKASMPKIILMSLLFIYVAVVFIGMFGFLFFSICEPFHSLNLDWFYFVMMAMVAFVLMFIGSVFATQSQIYDAKDNELLLSMPIKPGLILISRLIALYALNFLFGLVVCIPAAGVYGYFIGFKPLGITGFVLIIIALPLLSLAFSCIIGFLLQIISSRIRNKSFITAALSILFLILYFYFYSRFNTYLGVLITNGDILAQKFGKILPLYWIGSSISSGNILHIIVTLLFCLVPFAIVYYILNVSFIKISTAKRGFTKIKYTEQTQKSNSPIIALYKKELKHFWASPMYMLNGAMGVIMIIIGAAFLCIKKEYIAIFAEIPAFASYISPIVVLIVCFMLTTVLISPSTVSLEGKNLWISKTLPVNTSAILLSKAFLHISICIPGCLIASIVSAALIEMSPLMIGITFIAPLAFSVFTGFFGVILNLYFPKLDWISETIAVKQSISTVIHMFASLAFVLIPPILYGAILKKYISVENFSLIVTVIFIILCNLSYRFLVTKGAKIFEKL